MTMSIALPKTIAMIETLIAQPSVSSVSKIWDQSNEQVVDTLATWCQDLGFKVEKLAVSGCEGKFNMIATLGSGGEGLVLSGHTDTVPFDENKWNSDPFRLTEHDGRLFGLGTCDMKSFFAIALAACNELDLRKLKHPLVLLATADEESSMCGAKSLEASHRQLGRHAIIGEPTNMRPIRMHKGIGMECIQVIGHSGHSSNPSLGNNAIEGMNLVISELLSWRHKLQEKYQNPLFDIPVPTLNLGHIHGGDNPNRICDRCELHIDLRPLPGMDLDELRQEMDQHLKNRLADTGLAYQRTSLFDGIPAMETPASAEIVQAAERLTGYSATSVAFATEAPYLNNMGIQTLVMGPGSIDQAHQPNEYISLRQLQPATNTVKQLIWHFCQ